MDRQDGKGSVFIRNCVISLHTWHSQEFILFIYKIHRYKAYIQIEINNFFKLIKKLNEAHK